MVERRRHHLGDRAGQRIHADRQHRHLRVAREQRAVRAPAGVVPAGEVGELPARRGRDDQLARVRIRERRPRPLEAVRKAENRGVAARRFAREPQLLAVAPRDRLVTLAVQHDVDGGIALEARGESGRIAVGVHHRGAVRRRDEFLGKDVLQPRHVGHRRLAMIRAEDHRVPVEELVRPSRRVDQPAHRLVATCEHCVGGVWTLNMRGVVVVGEVEDEEVEAVAGHEPAPHGGGIGVDRPARAAAHRERRAGHVRLEQVVEEEAARAVRGAGEEGNGRPVRRPAAIARDVHGGGLEPRILERLVDRHGLRPEMARVQAVDRVDQRSPRSGRAHGAERGAVLDDPPLAAVIPDEVRDLVHVRMRAGGERREADRRQRGESGDGATVAPVLGEQRERRGGLAAERLLEHRRRQPVDHDQDELLRLPNPWRGS